MPIDLSEIAAAPKKALPLIQDAERRRDLAQFVESTAALVVEAARHQVQQLAEEINAGLAPHARVRLVQEGDRLVAEVVTLNEDHRRSWTFNVDSDVISRVLLRMPSTIKERASEAAQRAEMSLNSWTVTILERALTNLKQPSPEDDDHSQEAPN